MIKRFKKYWKQLFILAISLSLVWPLMQSGYFPHHDDLQVIRVIEMRKCLMDGQIPCRWVPDMGYGNGYPLFNYYAPFPYLVGALFSFFIGYLNSVKLLFALPLVFGGIFMYWFLKEISDSWGALLGGVLFSLVPYRALDVYVRGALNESWAISVVPLIFFFITRLAKKGKKKDLIWLSLSLFVFLTSHNIMTLFFFPLLCGYILFFKQNRLKIIFGILLGVGLSAYYIFPAYFEKHLVQTESLTRFELDYHANFVAVYQWFNRQWGYGSSLLGPMDELSFQIGYPHIFIIFIVPATSLWMIIRRKEKKPLLIISAGYLLLLFSIFMTHNRSTPIWEGVKILKYVQFPWRWLAVVGFLSSFLWGFQIFLIKKHIWLIGVIIGIGFCSNWFYFRPQKIIPITDAEKMSGKLWDEQQKGATLDYLPITALEPREKAPTIPLIREGNGKILDYIQKSNRWSLTTQVLQKANFEIPIFDFSGWQVWVNGSLINHNHQNSTGRIGFTLEPGSYQIEGRFTNTPVRTFANVITLISLILLGLKITIKGNYENT